MLAYDKTLITEKFYTEHTISFSDIEGQSDHQPTKKI